MTIRKDMPEHHPLNVAWSLWKQTKLYADLRLNYPPVWMERVSEQAFSAGWDAAVSAEARRVQAAKHLGGEDKSGLDFLGLALMIAIGAVCFIAGAMIF